MRPEFRFGNNSGILIGEGYEHLVYRDIRHPKYVFKISKVKLRAILSRFSGHDRPAPHLLDGYARTFFVPDIRRKNEQISELRAFFGAAHVPAERRYIAQPILRREFLQVVFGGSRGPPQWLGEREPVWTHVAVQAFCSAAQDPRRLSLSFGRLREDGPHDRSAVRSLNRILETADLDSPFRVALVEFVTRAIRYARKTGNILGLSAQDNVIFARIGDGWTYHLIDVMPISPARLLKQAEAIAKHASAGESLSARDREAVRLSLSFIRLIDGLAICLGMRDRLGLPAALAALDLSPVFVSTPARAAQLAG
jgi:hypothetical protein